MLFLLSNHVTFLGKVVAKFCAKFLHLQVLKNEANSAGDLGTSVQKAFFRFLFSLLIVVVVFISLVTTCHDCFYLHDDS